MSSKSILGIGNPLLDISVNASQEFFDKYNIKTASASLAEEKDKPLFEELPNFPDVSYLAGGATQNAIRGFAWMNPVKGKAHFIGCVGSDENAQLLKTVAEKGGVQTHYNVSIKGNTTGRCAAIINKDKERSLIADLSAANDYDPQHFESPEIQELIQGIDIFYSAGFFLTVSPETMVKIGKFCLGTPRVFAINLSAVFLLSYFWDQLNSVIPYADYIICNEDEASAFAEKSGWNSKDLEAAAVKMSQLPKEDPSRPRTVVITQGPNPTIVAVGGTARIYPVPTVESSKIIDTNGAGDAFVGGFLAGLALSKPLDVCVQAGNFAGGVVIQQEGPTYPEVCEYQWQ